MVRVISEKLFSPPRSRHSSGETVDKELAARAVEALSSLDSKRFELSDYESSSDSHWDSEVDVDGDSQESFRFGPSDGSVGSEDIVKRRKERRRERNKLSAQAYRMRRRELSVKTQNVLSTLEEENTRLKDQVCNLQQQIDSIRQSVSGSSAPRFKAPPPTPALLKNPPPVSPGNSNALFSQTPATQLGSSNGPFSQVSTTQLGNSNAPFSQVSSTHLGNTNALFSHVTSGETGNSNAPFSPVFTAKPPSNKSPISQLFTNANTVVGVGAFKSGFQGDGGQQLVDNDPQHQVPVDNFLFSQGAQPVTMASTFCFPATGAMAPSPSGLMTTTTALPLPSTPVIHHTHNLHSDHNANANANPASVTSNTGMCRNDNMNNNNILNNGNVLVSFGQATAMPTKPLFSLSRAS